MIGPKPSPPTAVALAGELGPEVCQANEPQRPLLENCHLTRICRGFGHFKQVANPSTFVRGGAAGYSGQERVQGEPRVARQLFSS